MTSDPLFMGKISYINASPVYYGLDHGLKPDWLTLVPDVPSALNRKILAGDIHISPISSAFYAMHHQDLLLLPGLSISCRGNVMSVLCVSRYPLEDLTGKQVLFSQESASAAAFMKMIFAERRIRPRFMVGPVGNMDAVPESVDAVLVIGDDALTLPWKERFDHIYDLGGVWHEMTGLPFVFAVWVVRKDYAATRPDRTGKALALLKASRDEGYRHMDEVIEAGGAKLALDPKKVRQYYDLLFCDLDAMKVAAMSRFFGSLHEQRIIDTPAPISFFNP